MEFDQVIRRRRMVARYDTDRPIPRATIDHLIDVARRAPSAGFSQGSHFLVLDDAASVAAYWAATVDPERAPDAWLTNRRTAPVLIVVWSDRAAYARRYAEPDKADAGYAPDHLDERWPVPYWHIDAGMAAHLLLLAAVDQGLGAGFFGVPTARVAGVRDRFAVPSRFTPVGVVSLGHPADPVPTGPGSKRPTRRARDEVVSYGSFGSSP